MLLVNVSMSANAWILEPTQVYTHKSHLLDEAHEGGSDDEDGRGPKMVYFDLKVDMIWLCSSNVSYFYSPRPYDTPAWTSLHSSTRIPT